MLRLMKDATKLKTSKAVRHLAASGVLPLRIQSILVPMDFSPALKKALGFAMSLARPLKGSLTLLHVVEPVATPGFVAASSLVMENDHAMTAANKQLEGMAERACLPRGMVEKIPVRFGRPFHEIAETTRTRKVDLIIFSTHGCTGLKHALHGSMTGRVARHARCPVLVLRQTLRHCIHKLNTQLHASP